MITYNQEKYIREAIEGVLMQKTAFNYQLVIGEDCSSDNTWQICKKYANQFPKKIKLLPKPGSNLGMMCNFIRTLEACNGKYIALCEGDDYWTDPLKLQLQVEFLINNTEYSFTAHRVFLREIDKNTPRKKSSNYKNELNFEYLSQNWFLNTCSFLFRNELKLEKSNFKNLNVADRFIALEVLKSGKGYIFDDCMGVYRIHKGGITKQDSSILNGLENLLSDFEIYYKDLDKDFKSNFEVSLKYQRLVVSLFKEKKMSTIINIAYYIIIKMSGKKAKIGNLIRLFNSI